MSKIREIQNKKLEVAERYLALVDEVLNECDNNNSDDEPPTDKGSDDELGLVPDNIKLDTQCTQTELQEQVEKLLGINQTPTDDTNSSESEEPAILKNKWKKSTEEDSSKLKTLTDIFNDSFKFLLKILDNDLLYHINTYEESRKFHGYIIYYICRPEILYLTKSEEHFCDDFNTHSNFFKTMAMLEIIGVFEDTIPEPFKRNYHKFKPDICVINHFVDYTEDVYAHNKHFDLAITQSKSHYNNIIDVMTSAMVNKNNYEHEMRRKEEEDKIEKAKKVANLREEDEVYVGMLKTLKFETKKNLQKFIVRGISANKEEVFKFNRQDAVPYTVIIHRYIDGTEVYNTFTYHTDIKRWGVRENYGEVIYDEDSNNTILLHCALDVEIIIHKRGLYVLFNSGKRYEERDLAIFKCDGYYKLRDCVNCLDAYLYLNYKGQELPAFDD